MNVIKACVLLGGMLLASAGAARGEDLALFEKPQFKVKVTKDIVYGAGEVQSPKPGQKDLLLDLYEPVGKDVPKLKPAFVAIHGGGFKNGTRLTPNMVTLCKLFASRGYVACSIEYRLQGDNPGSGERPLLVRSMQAAVQDATKSVEWLVRHASKHGIDTTRIAVGGSSAGGITSLMMTYIPRDDGKNAPVAAVVDLWGSLYNAVDKLKAGAPPVIIIHGMDDQVVKFTGAEAIVARCQEVGVPYELYAIEGAGHGVPLDKIVDGKALDQRIVEFLYKHLKLAELKQP